MAVINARLSIGEMECVVGIRYDRASRRQSKDRPLTPQSCKLSRSYAGEDVPTVRDFTLSSRERLAAAVASAAIVRDVAALGALVLFGTMLVLVLSSADLLV